MSPHRTVFRRVCFQVLFLSRPALFNLMATYYDWLTTKSRVNPSWFNIHLCLFYYPHYWLRCGSVSEHSSLEDSTRWLVCLALPQAALRCLGVFSSLASDAGHERLLQSCAARLLDWAKASLSTVVADAAAAPRLQPAVLLSAVTGTRPIALPWTRSAYCGRFLFQSCCWVPSVRCSPVRRCSTRRWTPSSRRCRWRRAAGRHAPSGPLTRRSFSRFSSLVFSAGQRPARVAPPHHPPLPAAAPPGPPSTALRSRRPQGSFISANPYAMSCLLLMGCYWISSSWNE